VAKLEKEKAALEAKLASESASATGSTSNTATEANEEGEEKAAREEEPTAMDTDPAPAAATGQEEASDQPMDAPTSAKVDQPGEEQAKQIEAGDSANPKSPVQQEEEGGASAEGGETAAAVEEGQKA